MFFVFIHNILLRFVRVKFALVAINVRFLYIICNFEIFSTVNSSMASKMAAKSENPIYL